MRRSVVVYAVVLTIVLAMGTTLIKAEPDNGAACWGQATIVFAQTGVMGEHASELATPRLGLRNLARALYQQGVIDDDSMQALGAFVADVLDLSIEACL